MDLSKPTSIKPTGNKYDTIQVLRFIAALAVIILHSTLFARERLKPGFALYAQGFNGVPLFFVISGFVMIISSQSLIKKIGAWKIFAVKRIIRIVPIYWIVTTYKLLLLIFASSLIYHARIDIIYILKSYFFIPAINVDGDYFPFYGVGWTLNFEMFFYLLFTISLFIKIDPVVSLSIIFIPLSILGYYKTADWPAAGFYANNIVLYFLYGMLVAKLILKEIKLPQKISYIVIVLGLLYLFFPRKESFGFYTNSSIIKHLSGFLIIYGAASIENFRSIKMPKWLVYLGGASYSLYLIHPSIAPLAPTVLKHLHSKSPWLSVLISVSLSVAAGTIFYKYCESKLTDFITKWAKKWGWI